MTAIIEPTTALQLFDALPSHIEDALRASISRFGVLVPVVQDQHGRVIDGHHRSRIADQLGVTYRIDVRHVADEDEAREIARTLNSDRRQLTDEQRREVVVHLRQLGHSERAIADSLQVGKTTVHRDIERAGIGPGGPIQPERVARQGGGSYPATRPKAEPADAGEPATEPVLFEDVEVPKEGELPHQGMPANQQRGDAIVTGIEQHLNGQPALVVEPIDEMPERPRPPKWDPQERRKHEQDVLRLRDITDAQQQAKTLVPDVRALIFTVLQGCRQGAKSLVTHDMVADIRRAVDLLEGEIDDEK